MENLQKLAWRCRRGSKELDLLLQKFLHQYYQKVSPELQQAFETMLEMQDPELYDVVIGRQKIADQYINQVIQYIHTQT